MVAVTVKEAALLFAMNGVVSSIKVQDQFTGGQVRPGGQNALSLSNPVECV